METPHHIAIPFLVETVAFLLSVVIIVPIFKRLKVSPILGYLAIGTAIGPHALGIISDVEKVQHFAELGVIFLLFTIGLELSFDRLKAFSKFIFGLGAAQVLISALVIAAVALFWGNSLQASAIIGLCLALSSTAMVVNLLNESGEFASRYGRASFSILLFQDLAVVPILILVSALGSNDSNLLSNIFFSLLRALIAVGTIILIGRFVLRYLFRTAARTHSVDVFTAMTLLVVLVTSIATGLAGLSMALGAFLAGLLLAETEFKHQIESEIEPFKGLFLGLFFMGVGMNLNLGVAFQQGFWVILSVIGIIAIKCVITTILCLLFKIRLSDAIRTGFILAESGEFAFVVIGQATLTFSLIEPGVGQFMIVVACISMMLTPLLAVLGRLLASRLESGSISEKLEDNIIEDTHDHVVIAGFGRMGKAVANVLSRQHIPYIAIDKDADIVGPLHKQNLPVFAGDVTRKELLERANISNASVLLITVNNAKIVKKIVETSKEHWPQITIIVRAYDESHSDELIEAGANDVVSETTEASLQLANHVLRALGITKEEAAACVSLGRS